VITDQKAYHNLCDYAAASRHPDVPVHGAHIIFKAGTSS
jgi:hypothetical protein